MSITIRPVQATDVPTLGRICFEAFGALQDRHGVERDFDAPETAEMVVGLFAGRPDFAGFVAVDDSGKILGSNFISFSDEVAGVGPITVRPDVQAAGVGRHLMQAVIDEAARRRVAQVRLLQEAINTASLSLYTKLGFDWREGCSLIRLVPAAETDPRISLVTEADLPQIDVLSKWHYHHSRVNEVRGFLKMGLPGVILRGGAPGYFFPGLLGHGFAQRPEDLADLVVQAARVSPPMFQKAILPFGEHALHRALMSKGCRLIKMLNYMTMGPYRRPEGAWMPSIGN